MSSPLFCCRLVTALALVAGIALSGEADAQGARADSLDQWIRRGYELGTPESRTIWRELGWSGVGFGFRTFAARKQASDAAIEQSLNTFGSLLDFYRIRLDELETTVDGDVGLAWGVHTEIFQVKGQPAESVRVRFTNTLRWDGKNWKNLLFHRDAQPFQPNGRYVRAPG